MVAWKLNLDCGMYLSKKKLEKESSTSQIRKVGEEFHIKSLIQYIPELQVKGHTLIAELFLFLRRGQRIIEQRGLLLWIKMEQISGY